MKSNHGPAFPHPNGPGTGRSGPDDGLPGQSEPLLTAVDVAAYLNVSRITIYDWAQKGKIPAFRLGHHWRFRRREIEQWLDENRHAPGWPGPRA